MVLSDTTLTKKGSGEMIKPSIFDFDSSINVDVYHMSDRVKMGPGAACRRPGRGQLRKKERKKKEKHMT